MSGTGKVLPLMVAGYIFGIVALVHLLRILFKLDILVSGYVLPMSVSYVAFVIALFLSVWMLKAANKQKSRF